MEYEVEVTIRSKRTQAHTTNVTSQDEAVLTIRNAAVSVDDLETLISTVEGKLIKTQTPTESELTA